MYNDIFVLGRDLANERTQDRKARRKLSPSKTEPPARLPGGEGLNRRRRRQLGLAPARRLAVTLETAKNLSGRLLGQPDENGVLE